MLTSTAINPPSNLWGRLKKRTLPFLVTRNQETNRLKFIANPPILRGTYICTLKTAWHICNSKVASNMEILHLRNAFRNSGYPTAFVARALRRIVLLNKRQPVVITTVILLIIFRVPTSEPVRWILSRENIRLAYKSGTTISSMVTQVDPQQPLEERTSVI